MFSVSAAAEPTAVPMGNLEHFAFWKNSAERT